MPNELDELRGISLHSPMHALAPSLIRYRCIAPAEGVLQLQGRRWRAYYKVEEADSTAGETHKRASEGCVATCSLTCTSARAVTQLLTSGDRCTSL